MSKHNIFLFILIVCLSAGTTGFADEEPVRQQIQQWIRQLGNESYLVRQRAEALLIRVGIQAFPELQFAKQSTDIEIARRAEYVLSNIEQAYVDLENREAAFWIHRYILNPNPAAKAKVIWVLANPNLDLAKGEGLPTLCRLVRFEENKVLQLEAVKSLIASPPLAPRARQHWYRYMRDNFHSTDTDEVLRHASDYAQLWCDLDDTTEKVTPEFQERVHQVSATTLGLLERFESKIQVGSTIDILLHYAVAELQDAVGLSEERDNTIALALAIVPEPIQSLESVSDIGGIYDSLLMSEHFYTGLYLKQRFRIRWAIAHFQKVTETGDMELRIEASRIAAESALYLVDYTWATTLYDEYIKIFQGTNHGRGDADVAIAQAQRRLAYFQAEQATAVENWESVREILMQAWAVDTPSNQDLSGDGGDIDLLILAHRLCKQLPDIDSEFKDKMDTQLTKAWSRIVADYDGAPLDIRQIKMVSAFNTAAWLLANTDGEYSSALTLVEAALKFEPDDLSILDTLAHIYFLGGHVEEAIRVQEQVVRDAPEAVVFRRALERFKK
ncbi:MAG: hypothetical protein FWE95_02500 [Planctomycetaceae bacterium]|nr:hypothetical protein [Planctomycetaceae bacterium]